MAKTTVVDPEFEPIITVPPVTDTASAEPINPGGYKVIINMQPCNQNIPLTDGTSFDLGPKFSNNRTSPPILGKLLNKEFIKRLEHENKIKVVAQ
jgi:hypothetical protein